MPVAKKQPETSPTPADWSRRIPDLLARSGLRRTPVRVGVLDVLAASPRPMSVPQLLGKMKGVDTVTVYRMLNTFVRKRLVHRVRGEDRGWLYAIGGDDESDRDTPRQHQHPHFVCDACGKVECLENSRVPETFVASLHVSSDYRVSWPEVVLHGRCPRCRTGV